MGLSTEKPLSPERSKPQAYHYTLVDCISVRAPLFPVEAYLALQKATDGPASSSYTENPLVQRALAIGSVDLLNALERQPSSARDGARRERKLLRYLIRMATRPTPYGLFAGVSLAHWGEQTDLYIAAGPRTLFSRPDLHWLLPLLWGLETLPEIRSHLRYLANEAAFVRRGRILLQEQLSLGQPHQKETVSLRATPVALHVLKLARQPISHHQLVQELRAAVPSATLSQIETLITTLWQHTVLFTDLHPPLTGQIPPAQYVLQRLQTIPCAAPLILPFQNLLHTLALWDQASNEKSLERYREVQHCAQKFSTQVEALLRAGKPTYQRQGEQKSARWASSTLVQTDSTFSLEGTHLARTLGEEIAQFGQRMVQPQGPTYLETYRKAFVERYGQDRAVPLLEVMDPQIGLGIPAFDRDEKADKTDLQVKREQELLRLALTALRERQMAISLDEENLQRLGLVPPDDPATLPPSFDLFVSLAAPSQQAVERGECQIIIESMGAHQAGQNLGRFASHLGRDAIQALEYAARKEDECDPHVIQAELVYATALPRLMNVTLRPAIRPYEIVYGVVPGREMEHTIPLDELLLGVRGEHFYLYWPRKQMEVRPCSGHMLNPKKAPAIMRFLSELPLDGSHMLWFFHWGPYSYFPFLPRLQFGRIVFSLAKWPLTSSFHLNELILTSSEQFRQTLDGWRKRWQVPRYVYLTEGDNRLLLDLEHPAQIEELRAVLQARKEEQAITLQEALPGPEHAWLEGPDGHYFSEYVVSLVKRPAAEPVRMIPIPHGLIGEQQERMNAERLKTPGSEWLFLKLYCSSALQEELIAGPLRALVEEVFEQKLADSWFFIRYADPRPHLRIRFRGTPAILTSQLFPMVSAWASRLVSAGPCLTFLFDSYEREIERYGGLEGIAVAEKLFEADSHAVVELLHLKQTRALTLDSQLLTVLTIDQLLAGLGWSPQERLQWYEKYASDTKEAGILYRQNSPELRALLGDPQYLSELSGGKQLEAILTKRGMCLSQIAQQFSERRYQQDLLSPLSQIYASFAHMHYNRLQGIDRQKEQHTLQLARRTWKGLLASHLRCAE